MSFNFFFKSIYTFVFTIVLQILIFDNIQISVFVHIPFYLIYLIILPAKTNKALLLILAFLLGITIDYIHGSSGTVTASLLLTSLARIIALKLLINRDLSVSELSLVSSNITAPIFILYSSIIVVVFSSTLFFIENIGFMAFYYTLLQIAISSVVTVIVMYIFEAFYPKRF